MGETQLMAWTLQVTECDIEAQVFRQLGGASWLTEDERDEAFERVPPDAWPVAGQVRSWCVDVVDPDGSITADRPISEETACALLGVDDLDELRAAADERIAAEVAS